MKNGTIGTPRAAYEVPAAVKLAIDTGVVYVVADHSVERRAVGIGAASGAGRLVLSGLTAGTRVALGDLATLADGVRIRIVE